MKILILIPSYNDSNHLPELIQRIRQNSDNAILIVDDGSEIPIYLTEKNVKIIRNKTNVGKGEALKNGFAYASENGYSHVITMDSDLQHDPNKLIDFIRGIDSYDEDNDETIFQVNIGIRAFFNPIESHLENKEIISKLNVILSNKLERAVK